MKQHLSHNTGFTLIEILVVIALIMFFAISVTNLDFSRLSERQQHEIFINDVITKMETIRNYGFQGKGIGVNLDTPDVWTIDISDTSSGSFLTQYSGVVSGTFPDASFVVDSGYEISGITCKNVGGTRESTSAAQLTIIGNSMTLSGCSNTTLKILEMSLTHKSFTDIVEVNTINNIIQRK